MVLPAATAIPVAGSGKLQGPGEGAAAGTTVQGAPCILQSGT